MLFEFWQNCMYTRHHHPTPPHMGTALSCLPPSPLSSSLIIARSHTYAHSQNGAFLVASVYIHNVTIVTTLGYTGSDRSFYMDIIHLHIVREKKNSANPVSGIRDQTLLCCSSHVYISLFIHLFCYSILFFLLFIYASSNVCLYSW